MQRGYQIVLGVVACAMGGTPALAQTDAKPMLLKPPYPQIQAEGAAYLPASRDSQPGSPDSVRTVYLSTVHAVALRGVTLTGPDSAAVKKIVAARLKELREATIPLWHDTTAAGRAAWDKFQIEFFRKHMPEIRVIVSPVQQAIFDANVQAMEASDYTFVDQLGQPLLRAGHVTRLANQ
jgi:hypothetical protein